MQFNYVILLLVIRKTLNPKNTLGSKQHLRQLLTLRWSLLHGLLDFLAWWFHSWIWDQASLSRYKVRWNHMIGR
jgi:hypothetical protein